MVFRTESKLTFRLVLFALKKAYFLGEIAVMKFSKVNSLFNFLIRSMAVPGLLVMLAHLSISAQTTTFAQFFEMNGSQDFVFANNSSSGDFKTVPSGSPVLFIYQNIANLDPSLQGSQNAHMYVTTTTRLAGSVNGSTLSQPLNQQVTIQIVRDTPTAPGIGSGLRTLLLSVTFAPSAGLPAISGSVGGDSATLQASTPTHNVQFYSNFVSFGATTDRNLALSFSSATPSINLGPGSYLVSNTAAASGTFASNPPPIPAIPTAGRVSLGGRVLNADGLGIRNALVTMTDQDGVVRKARTNSFGFFEFADVVSGQSVIVGVNSKQYRFQARLVTLVDSVTDFNFMAGN